jgi:hypothetical protein
VIWLDTIRGFFARESKPTVENLETAGRHAVEIAAARWRLNIYDPRQSDKSDDAQRCRNQIDGYIRDGLGWTWEPPYAGDGDFEWCGAFAATCWLGIKSQLRKTYFASTYRLDRYARGGSVNGERNAKGERLIAELDEHSTSLPWEPRAGDILLIGPSGSGYGKHICLVESYADRMFTTIEGNGTGLGPNGKRRQGVVRATRYLGTEGRVADGVSLWHARRLIRPAAADLVS